jgi:hypothetical protein
MKRGRVYAAAVLMTGLLGACGGGDKAKQPDAQAQSSTATAPAETAAPQRPAGNPILEAARSQGVSRCLPRIGNLANGLTQGATYRAYAVTDDKKADERLYSLVLSRLSSQGTHQLVSVTVVPDQACSATYDVSTVWGAPCAQIAQQAFGSFKPATALPGDVTVLQGSPLQQVYLLATPGGGCLTLQKETLY